MPRTDRPARAVARRHATWAQWARAMGEDHGPPDHRPCRTRWRPQVMRRRGRGSARRWHRESQPTADTQALVGERVGGLDSTTRGPRGNGQPDTWWRITASSPGRLARPHDYCVRLLAQL